MVVISDWDVRRVVGAGLAEYSKDDEGWKSLGGGGGGVAPPGRRARWAGGV